jgi:hypothetical protein
VKSRAGSAGTDRRLLAADRWPPVTGLRPSAFGKNLFRQTDAIIGLAISRFAVYGRHPFRGIDHS